MTATLTLQELMTVLIRMDSTFILQNDHGSMELRGNDFYLSPYKEWLTIYHTTQSRGPESRSHLHLRWQTLQCATIRREEGHTPHLAFFGTAEPAGEPLLVWYFPSFYDWSQNKAEIPANIEQYDAFVQTYGTTLKFVEPSE
jgi:hypothetical protein